MKLVKNAGITSVKLSKSDWESIGKKHGWLKEANYNFIQELNGTIDSTLDGLLMIKGALSQGFSGDRDSVIFLAEELNDLEKRVTVLKNAIRNSGRAS